MEEMQNSYFEKLSAENETLSCEDEFSTVEVSLLFKNGSSAVVQLLQMKYN